MITVSNTAIIIADETSAKSTVLCAETCFGTIVALRHPFLEPILIVLLIFSFNEVNSDDVRSIDDVLLCQTTLLTLLLLF